MTLLNPDMPAQELRLHMGELTADELLVARAAIRWANFQADKSINEAIKLLESHKKIAPYWNTHWSNDALNLLLNMRNEI